MPALSVHSLSLLSLHTVGPEPVLESSCGFLLVYTQHKYLGGQWYWGAVDSLFLGDNRPLAYHGDRAVRLLPSQMGPC